MPTLTSLKLQDYRRALCAALECCPNLSSWTCNYGMIPLITFATAAPTQQALQIDLSGQQEGELPDSFQTFPMMRFLQLGRFPQFVRFQVSNEDFKAHKPPKMLQPQYLYDTAEIDISYRIEHSSGVHIAVVDDLDVSL